MFCDFLKLAYLCICYGQTVIPLINSLHSYVINVINQALMEGFTDSIYGLFIKWKCMDDNIIIQ